MNSTRYSNINPTCCPLNPTFSKRGFTLVELLVVISIIGILSGIFLNRIGDFRDRAEDARRIADIRHVQTLLELYYNKCQSYPNPNTPSGGGCTTGSMGNGPVQWSTLETMVVGSGLGTKAIPEDPDKPKGKNYEYGSNGDGYAIKATLNKPDNPQTRESSRGTLYGIICGAAPEGQTQKEYCVEF